MSDSHGSYQPPPRPPMPTPPGPQRALRVERRHKRPSRRRKILIAALAVAAVTAGAAGYAVNWAQSSFDNIPRFPTTSLSGNLGDHNTLQLPARQAHQPENFLLYSVGSFGLTSDGAKRAGIFGGRATMPDKLTDSIMLVMIHPDTGKVGILSIPRDTWVPQYGEKINAIYELQGPQAFADEITKLTGMPVNHMLALNFAAFADLTNAVQGVDLYVRTPMRDPMSYLNLTKPGCTHFDGATALQFVRSRHTQVQSADGRWHTDPSADDFGRMARQQDFLKAASKKVLTPNGVLEIPDLIQVAQHNVTMDAGLTAGDALSLMQSLVAGHGTSLITKTVPGTVGWAGAASVVFVTDEDAHTAASELEAQLTGQADASSSTTSTPDHASISHTGGSSTSTEPATGTPCTP